MKKLVRYLLAIVAFIFVWVVFPNRWLLDMGLGAILVGLLKLLTAIGTVLLVIGLKRPEAPVETKEGR